MSPQTLTDESVLVDVEGDIFEGAVVQLSKSSRGRRLDLRPDTTLLGDTKKERALS